MKRKMEITFNHEIVENFMAENKLSKTAFCKLCKITPLAFYKFMNNDDSLFLLPVFKIAKAIGVELKDMFEKD